MWENPVSVASLNLVLNAIFCDVILRAICVSLACSPKRQIDSTPLGVGLETDLLPSSNTLTVGLMTKFWDCGKVKTRLGNSIGMERAVSLHRLFVSHLCATLSQVPARRVLCIAPDHRLAAMESALKSWGLDGKWELMAQGQGPLGERMERCFIHSLRDETSRAMLIGADCPQLGADQIDQASEALQTNDVVVGPAADGGYYLIGLKGAWRANESRFKNLFHDIPWSTDRVLGITRGRIDSAGLSCFDLEMREDVDTIKELASLRRSLELETDQHAELKTEIDRILAGISLSDPSSGDIR